MFNQLLAYIEDNHYELEVVGHESPIMLHVYYRVRSLLVARLQRRTGSLNVELGRSG